MNWPLITITVVICCAVIGWVHYKRLNRDLPLVVTCIVCGSWGGMQLHFIVRYFADKFFHIKGFADYGPLTQATALPFVFGGAFLGFVYYGYTHRYRKIKPLEPSDRSSGSS